MKHSVGYTHNGVPVVIDLIHSSAAKHIAQQPHILGLAEEVLRKVTLHDDDVSIEYDMGRSIGYNFVVGTKETDTVFYAQLIRDNVYSRFVKNGKPLATQYLTLVLKRRDDDPAYDLLDVWVGNLNPPRPGSDDETAESIPYWQNHAFILDTQQLQTRTITKVCPYGDVAEKVQVVAG
jgi:hypothetical protein